MYVILHTVLQLTMEMACIINTQSLKHIIVKVEKLDTKNDTASKT